MSIPVPVCIKTENVRSFHPEKYKQRKEQFPPAEEDDPEVPGYIPKYPSSARQLQANPVLSFQIIPQDLNSHPL
jgi:hypothetical protein